MRKTTQSPFDEAFICPITHEIMFDPVVADDGETYEREAIEEHINQLREKNKSITSPLHNVEMDERLVPNRRMLSQIKDCIQQNPQYAEQVYFSKKAVIKLLEALNCGDKLKITEILRQDKRLLAKPLTDNKSLIQLACEQKDLEILKFILEQLKQAKLLSFEQNELDRLITLCLKSTGQAGIKVILEQCLQLDKNQLKAFLHNKIKQGDEELITIWLNINLLGIDEPLDEEQNTALHLAAFYDQRLIGKLLIESSANVKIENSNGQTPEVIAASKGHREFAVQIKDWLQRKDYLPLLKRLEELETENKKQQIFMQSATAFFKHHLQPADEYLASQCIRVNGRLRRLLQDGSAIIDDNNSTWLWSSKTTQLEKIPGSFNQILDNGNIITQQNNETIFWEAQTKQIHKLQGNFDQVLPNGNILTTIAVANNSSYDYNYGYRTTYSTGLFNVKTGKFYAIQGQFQKILATDSLITQHDNSAMLWDSKTEKTYALTGDFRQLLGDTNIITATSDETIIWNIKTAERLHTLKGKFEKLLVINHLIVTSTHENVAIFSSKTGQNITTLPGSFQKILPNEAVAITDSRDSGQILIWFNENKAIKLQGQIQEVLPDGSIITSYNANSQLWDTETNRVHTLQGQFMKKLPNGDILFSYNNQNNQANSSCTIWDTKAKKAHVLPGILTKECTDGTIITSSYNNGQQINIWQAKNRAVYTEQGNFRKELFNGSLIINKNSDKTTHLWNAATRRVSELQGRFCQTIADGNIFITQQHDYVNSQYRYKTLFWNADAGILIYTLEGNWQQEKDNIFTCSDNNYTRRILLIWDATFKKLYEPKDKNSNNLNEQWQIIKTLSDDSIIALNGEKTLIWNPTKNDSLILEGQFHDINFNGDIITSTKDKTYIWDAAIRDQQNYILPGQFKQLLSNGNIVASTQEQTIIWDFTSGKTYKLPGAFLKVLSDRNIVAYSSTENVTTLWNTKTKAVYTLRGKFEDIALSGHIVTTFNSSVLIWQRDQKHLTLNVNFSQQEIADLQKQAPECKLI